MIPATIYFLCGGGCSFFLIALDCACEADALSDLWIDDSFPMFVIQPVHVELNIPVLFSHGSIPLQPTQQFYRLTRAAGSGAGSLKKAPAVSAGAKLRRGFKPPRELCAGKLPNDCRGINDW